MGEDVAKWPEAAVDRVPELPRMPSTDLGKFSDAELMARLKNGEQEALSHLFDRYHRLVLSIALKILRDHAEAEDLMQEVFFDVYRVADRFDPAKGTAKNWMVQIAFHKGLNRRKYLALRGTFENHQIERFDPPEFPFQGHNTHSSGDIFAIVQQGLATLPPKQRETVEMVCFQGFVLREIADHTAESLGNVRHYYYRGIEKLRDFVKRSLQA